jgi:hypothetical protein
VEELDTSPPPAIDPATDRATTGPEGGTAGAVNRRRVPRPAVAAVILLEVIALGSLAVAFLLLLVTGELGLQTTGSVTLTVIGCLVLALAAVPAGVGVWRGRSWGWAIAVVIGLAGGLAVVTAALDGGFQPELIVAFGVFVALLACLFSAPVRRRSGIA